MITTISLSPAVDKVYFVENFKAGSLYRVRNMIKSAGGKGINVARVASILGEDVRTLGFKAGGTGIWLEDELKKFGVDTRFIEVDGESRTNNNIIDRLSGIETEILEIGPFIGKQAVDTFIDVYTKTLPGTSIIVCSGGLPEGIPVDFYKTLIELAKPYGIKAILDTSNDTLEEGIKAKPFMIKPNLRELSRLMNKTLKDLSEIIDACRFLNSTGIEVVVTSLGKDGAVLVSQGQILKMKAVEIPVINTIGSGDSMVAGCAASLARGGSPEDMLRLGAACAVANTQFTEIGFVSSDLVEKYKNSIEILSL